MYSSMIDRYEQLLWQSKFVPITPRERRKIRSRTKVSESHTDRGLIFKEYSCMFILHFSARDNIRTAVSYVDLSKMFWAFPPVLCRPNQPQYHIDMIIDILC
jgi:LPS sulfotransferase NodH